MKTDDKYNVKLNYTFQSSLKCYYLHNAIWKFGVGEIFLLFVLFILVSWFS